MGIVSLCINPSGLFSYFVALLFRWSFPSLVACPNLEFFTYSKYFLSHLFLSCFILSPTPPSRSHQHTSLFDMTQWHPVLQTTCPKLIHYGCVYCSPFLPTSCHMGVCLLDLPSPPPLPSRHTPLILIDQFVLPPYPVPRPLSGCQPRSSSSLSHSSRLRQISNIFFLFLPFLFFAI
ncbi:hypothetical protein K435DRAFT_137135 [Dendrothele bispora CBS 962.96]|uniref:Uncharacterized protein n=1 Tax=Dendrothele bispora (strain CBS 962.96) TaxID=1314807 RepID=A0A4S8MPZ4_DENBC|nr:hypothetical protein K435DRAFT_137135 [Dendrothele bispora CBS 962.96]